jgi:hypothetical protein
MIDAVAAAVVEVLPRVSRKNKRSVAVPVATGRVNDVVADNGTQVVQVVVVVKHIAATPEASAAVMATVTAGLLVWGAPPLMLRVPVGGASSARGVAVPTRPAAMLPAPSTAQTR